MSFKINQLFILLISLLLVSCSGDDDATIASLSGKYIITKIEATGCNDPEEELSLSGSSNSGLCDMVDGEEICINVCITFNDGTYTSEYSFSGGGFTFSSMDSGTYDPGNNSSEICIDGDCGSINVQDGGNKFVFTGSDPDTGCNLRMEMEKV